MHGNKQNVTGYVDYVEGKVTQEDLYEGQLLHGNKQTPYQTKDSAML